VASPRGTVAIVSVATLPFLAIAIVLAISNPIYINGCVGCVLSPLETYILVGEGLFFLIFGVYFEYIVAKIPDPWQLRRETGLTLLWCFFSFIGFVVSSFLETDYQVAYDHQLLICTGLMGFMASQSIYQVWLGYVEYKNGISRGGRGGRYYNHQERTGPKSMIGDGGGGGGGGHHIRSKAVSSRIESIGGTTLKIPTKLQDILNTEPFATSFEKFLTAELGLESLFFLRDVATFKKQYYDLQASARLSRVKRLYTKFIDPRGNYPINIPSSMSTSIRAEIATGTISESIFDPAIVEIENLLQNGAVARFLHSQAYLDIVTAREEVIDTSKVELSVANFVENPSGKGDL
jgi:hypothetical protein